MKGDGRRIAAMVGLAVVAVAAAWALGDSLSFARLAAERDRLIGFSAAQPLAAMGLFLAIYVVIVAFSVPGAAILSMTGGYIFGAVLGTALNALAATIGAICIFLAVRWGLGEGLSRRIDAQDGRVKQIREGLRRNEWAMLFLIRLAPTVPFFVANLIPALLNVRLGRFVMSTALGILPGTLVITSIGTGLGDVFATGAAEPDLSALLSARLLVPLAALCLLILLPVLWRETRRRRAA